MCEAEYDGMDGGLHRQIMQCCHVVQFPIILWAVCFLTLRWSVTLATSQQCRAQDRNIQITFVCMCVRWYLCLHVSHTEETNVRAKGGEREQVH